MTLSRTNRPLVLTALVVTFAVLPRTWATVMKFVPSLETWRSKSRVLNEVPSPPAPAWRSTIDDSAVTAPRSTWRNSVAAPEHHLSLLPPDTLPLTALSGVSLLLHGVEPVAGLFSARLSLGGGGGVLPLSKDGGASPAALPHEVFAVVPR